MKNFLSLFLIVPLFVFSQNQHKIDSLKTILEKTTNPKKNANLNLEISKLIENKDRDESLLFAKNAEKIAREIKNHDLLNKSFLQQGKIFYKQKKDATALEFFNKIDSLYKIDKIITEEYFMSKIYRAEISKFTFTMPGVLQAKQYILQSLQLAKSIDNQKLIHLAKYRLGEWHGFISQAENPKQHLDTASVYMRKVLNYYQEKNDYEFIARVYYTMASIEISRKNYKAAEVNYKKRLAVIKKSSDSTKIAEAYYGLGSIYRNFKQPDKGLKYLDSAAIIFKKAGFSSDGRRKNLYRDYAYLYELKKDYKNAFKNMQKAIVFKDTLYEEKNNKIAMELDAKYQSKEKKQEIVLLKQQKINQRNLLLSGLALTSLAGLFFFFQYRNRQKTTKKLHELDKAKSTFFANISHEFRTPLTLISGPIQQQLKKENLQIEERNNLHMMQRNADRLLSLVDQILDISKIESGNLPLQVSQNDIFSFVGTLVDSFSFIAAQKEIKFSTNSKISEINTWYDKDFLEKIILNLLSNAIKYTPKKGSIVCDTFIEENTFHFEIKNTGKGLSKNEIKHIFKRFYQKNTHNKGVGIGLALVKKLIQLHKGTINVDSNINDWTIFKVTLPIAKTVYHKNEITAINNESNTITKINTINEDNDPFTENDDKPILLIVEDNTEVINYVSTIFNNEYTILKAKNGAEGIELAIKQIPDIIISDIMMPVKSGIDLCNTLKTDEFTSHIPIILLTAKAGDEHKIEGLKTGADAYITKPFNEELLIVKVNQLLKIRKQLQKRYSQEVILKPTDLAIDSTEELFLNRMQKILDEKLIESTFNTEKFYVSIGMSRMQLHRKLKALFGMTTSEFIRSQRLKLAADLLKKSDVNVSQIGYSVGFNDHAYFSKCFKKMFNCTPSDFAKKHQ